MEPTFVAESGKVGTTFFERRRPLLQRKFSTIMRSLWKESDLVYRTHLPSQIGQRVQRKRHIRCGLKTLFGIFFQAAMDNTLQSRRRHRGKLRNGRWIFVEHCAHRVGGSSLLEGALAR